MDSNDIDKAMNTLCGVDNDIASAHKTIGSPAPRIRDNNIETLLSIVVSQQISTEAARSIMSRMEKLLPGLTASSLLNIDDQALRDAGLSWRKVAYVKGLAEAVMEDRVNFERMTRQTDSEVIETITSLKGFGRWSADIYLMFSLRRQDVFPSGDLALQIALGNLKGLDEKPSAQCAIELTEHWAPHRSVGALFLWHYYRGMPQ